MPRIHVIIIEIKRIRIIDVGSSGFLLQNFLFTTRKALKGSSQINVGCELTERVVSSSYIAAETK